MFRYYIECSVRSLGRNWGLSVLMILALSIGIGASMTTLSIIRILSGDPLPGLSSQIYYPQIDARPDHHNGEPLDALDYTSAVDLWRAGKADQQAIMASSRVKAQPGNGDTKPLMLSVLSTSGDFFPMFNIPFSHGRSWGPDEEAGRARVAVISHALNKRMFHGANSVGRTLRLNNVEFVVIGVLGAWRPSPMFYNVRGGRFSGGETSAFYDRPDDVFVPFETGVDANDGSFLPFTCWAKPPSPGNLRSAPCAWIALWVRIRDKSHAQEYSRFVASYAAEQRKFGRIGNADNTRLRNLTEWLDFNNVVPRDIRIQTAVAFAFLMICITNVIGLLLAKFLRESREIGLRRALGASRRNITRQCLMDSLIIGCLGGLGGLLLSVLAILSIRLQPLAYADMVHLDMGMLFYTACISMIASVAAGVLPALRASRIQPSIQAKGF